MESLDLSVPGQKSRHAANATGLKIMVALLLVLSAVHLGLASFRWFGKSEHGSNAGVDVSDKQQGAMLENLALTLERRGLHGIAADYWHELVKTGDLTDEREAEIWYKIGTLRQLSDEHRQALAAFYRSEALAKLPGLEEELKRRIPKSLRAIGAFAALNAERDAKVSYVPDEGKGSQESDAADEEPANVVAEIGAWKITESELQKEMEKQIEFRFSQMASYMPENILKQRIEQTLQAQQSPEKKKQFLREFVTSEILYRAAKDKGLAQKPGIQHMLRISERVMLGEMMLRNKILDQIKISEADLRNYYGAHKEAFTIPAGLKLQQIVVENQEVADEVMAALKNDTPFSELAEKYSIDAQSKENGGQIDPWITADEQKLPERLRPLSGIFSVLADLEVGALYSEPLETEQGLHIIKVARKRAPRVRPFQEVVRDIQNRLWAEEADAVRAKVLRNLKDEYDVAYHWSALEDKAK